MNASLLILLIIFSSSAVSAEVEKAGALGQIIVNIVPDQIVGQPLRLPAQIILLDDSSQLVPNYDLTINPITLSSSKGVLTPNIINDNNLFSNGLIDLSSLGISYFGSTGPVEITASNGTISSQPVIGSFSGYDILGAFDRFGSPLSFMYADQVTTIKVPVTNYGNLTASGVANIKSFFTSGGGSVKLFFAPSSNGIIDSLNLDVPTNGMPAGVDTLVLVVESQYQVDQVTVFATDTLKTPITIVSAIQLILSPDSFKPDSIYAGIPANLSFVMQTAGLSGSIDGSNLTISILSDSGNVLTVPFTGLVNHDNYQSGLISYSSIPLLVDSSINLAPGWYQLDIDYYVIFNGNRIVPTVKPVDSIYILPSSSLNYTSGSLSPVIVNADEESSFSFDLQLSGAYPVFLDPLNSTFHLSGNGFSISTGLLIDGDSLVNGSNILRSGPIFFPPEKDGLILDASATITYAHTGAGNTLTYSSNFNNQMVEIGALPVVRILETKLIAPDPPHVNTNQNFQILCRIANMSTSDLSAFQLQMVSDGNSIFQPNKTIPTLLAEDTIDVFFDVTASAQSAASEIFRIDISTLGINQLPPLDNLATVTIEIPANLSLSHFLIGADDGYLTPSANFSLIVTLSDSGESITGTGLLQLNTYGLDLGIPDSTVNLISVDAPVNIAMVAPAHDTTIRIGVELIQRPLDRNTNLPAQIDKTFIELTIDVISTDINFIITPIQPSSNIVFPGTTKELISFILKNEGKSSATDILVESMQFQLKDQDILPLQVSSVLIPGNTRMEAEGTVVARADSDSDRLSLIFNNFVVNAGTEVKISLISQLIAVNGQEFSLEYLHDSTRASFLSGPLAGLSAAVTQGEGSDSLASQVFTAVDISLGDSFIIKDNPFNPNIAPAELRYFLPDNSSVELIILNLTGELVHSRKLTDGEPGTLPGENVIFWDGQNDNGQTVLNGVYVAVLTTLTDGNRAMMKIAVLK